MSQFSILSQKADICIDEFEKNLKVLVESDNTDFNEIVRYTFAQKGKRIRPLLVYLSAKIFGEINLHTHNAALMVEMLHTATLIHDDVVDESDLRRNKATLNKVYGNKIAVLAGDHLFAKALGIATINKEYALLDAILPTIEEMSEGELIQLRSWNFNINREKYVDIIYKKTASLISTCMELGALSVDASPENVAMAKRIGKNIGYIFQIKDDILDYVGSEMIGKKIGNDIAESKITLPIICAWENMSEIEREGLQMQWNCPRTSSSIDDIRTFVIEKGGIENSEKEMQRLKEEIISDIEKLPSNKNREVLQEIINYIIEREN